MMRKKVKVSASNNNIPEDVILQILHKLPVKSLLRFSCVSKLWFNLINNDPQFKKYHMVESQKRPILMFTFTDCHQRKKFYYVEKEEYGNHSLLPYKKEKTLDIYKDGKLLIGYDNGLSCSWNCSEHYNGEWVYFSFAICNHSRNEELITVSRLQTNMGEGIHGFRFGYDLLGDKYKVMCIMTLKDEYEYYIFTLGSTEPWRRILNPWPKRHPLDYFSSSRRSVTPAALSCNGTLFYEMVKDKAEKELYNRFALVSFDLHCEKFQIIKLPGDDEFVSNFNNRDFFPMEYKGCFCYSYMKKFDPYSGEVILHILEDMKHIWVKETIKFHLPRELTTSTRIVNFSNQMILHSRMYNKQQNGHVIKFYNVHTKELKEVKHLDEVLYSIIYLVT